MKLSPLNLDFIFQAAEKINEEGIPRDRVWSEYYVIVNGKEYPFKYLVYLALNIAGIKGVKFESNDGYRNFLQNQLGFTIVYYKEGYNFFTKDELDYFTSIIGKPYRKSEFAHQAYPNKLNSLIAKVNYWAKAVKPEDYKLKRDVNWLTGFRANIKPYIWPRIFKDKDHGIFFNVEVHGKERFIGYKLDGYYETRKQLSAGQIKILNDFKSEINWVWEKISFDDLEHYDWPTLIRETKNYISQYDSHYDYLKKQLYKENLVTQVSWNRSQHPLSGFGKTNPYFGYGEWLLNSDHVIDDNKYVALPIITQNFELYSGKIYDISIITIDPIEGRTYWIATLRNVEVINREEAIAVANKYKQNGWIQEMTEDLEEVGVDSSQIEERMFHEPLSFFNIKFNIRQLSNLPIALVPVNDLEITYDATGAVNLPNSDEINAIEIGSKASFSFEDSGSTEADLKKRGRRRGFTMDRELEFKHNELQQKLLKYLQKKHNRLNVKRECNAFGGCRIDLVRKTETGYVFYEIKTYNNLLTSIRMGIGQLLEYNLFPKKQQAEKMVLVSHLPANKEVMEYILHLKSVIHLEFTYMHFDIEKECVVSEI